MLGLYSRINRTTSTLDSNLYNEFFKNLERRDDKAKELLANFYRTEDPIYGNEIRGELIDTIKSSIERETEDLEKRAGRYMKSILYGLVLSAVAINFLRIPGIFIFVPVVFLASSYSLASRMAESFSRISSLSTMKCGLISDGNAVYRVLEKNQEQIKMQLRSYSL